MLVSEIEWTTVSHSRQGCPGNFQSAGLPPSASAPMSMFVGAGVSGSVSDDDIEDSSRSKLRTRRRRKKYPPRGGNCHQIFRRVFSKIIKWRMGFLSILIITLFLYEWRRIAKEPQQVQIKVDPVDEKELPGNLGRLDMPTRAVNGTREPCLKLLPSEEVAQLEIPLVSNGKLPVKNVVYKSFSETGHNGDNSGASFSQMESTRFNFFTGFQSLDEREDSFKLSETSVVHCGFYSETGGFKISEEDKNFMRSCKAVVSTCTFGGGDDLYQPIGMSPESLGKVCYVAFWDEITLQIQESEGKTIDQNHMIDKWRIVIVKDLPFSDQRLNGKIPKMLGHRLFPEARYSIWVDSKSQFRRDPIGALEALLWRSHSSLAISEHGARSNVYDEAKAIVKKHKATPEEVEIQLTQYRRDGFPEDKRFNGKKALSEASVILREHNSLTNLFMCIWFNEVVRFTSRDQLSFPYVVRRIGVLKINMFPVCTRKSLVNSIGHKRKAKPLIVSLLRSASS